MSDTLTHKTVGTPYGDFEVWLSAGMEYSKLKVQCLARLSDHQATYTINGRQYDGYMWLTIVNSSNGGYVYGSSMNPLTDSARRKLGEALLPTGKALLESAEAQRAAIAAWLESSRDSAQREAEYKIEAAERDAKRALDSIGE